MTHGVLYGYRTIDYGCTYWSPGQNYSFCTFNHCRTRFSPNSYICNGKFDRNIFKTSKEAKFNCNLLHHSKKLSKKSEKYNGELRIKNETFFDCRKNVKKTVNGLIYRRNHMMMSGERMFLYFLWWHQNDKGINLPNMFSMFFCLKFFQTKKHSIF